MNLAISPCVDRAIWDQFLEEHAAQTFLQSSAWQTISVLQGQKTFSLLVHEGEELVAIALVLAVHAKRGSYLLCAHGPIISAAAPVTEILRVLTSELKELAKAEHCDFLRVCPLFPNTSEEQKRFATLGYRPAPIHQTPELSWILDLQKNEEGLLQEMRKATRYTIKHSEKDDITVTMSDRIEDLDRFLAVYHETVDRQNFTPFSKKYFETEFETFQKQGQALFFFGECQGQTISTAIVLFSKHTAFYHHGASSHKFPKINASSAVQWEAIKEAKRRGCTSYNFWGIAPPDQPKHPWVGLTTFKTGFGGRAEAYLHAQDKPLTLKYWLNYMIEKIRARRRGFRY